MIHRVIKCQNWDREKKIEIERILSSGKRPCKNKMAYKAEIKLRRDGWHFSIVSKASFLLYGGEISFIFCVFLFYTWNFIKTHLRNREKLPSSINSCLVMNMKKKYIVQQFKKQRVNTINIQINKTANSYDAPHYMLWRTTIYLTRKSYTTRALLFTEQYYPWQQEGCNT